MPYDFLSHSQIILLAGSWRDLTTRMREQLDHGSADSLCSITYDFFSLCQDTFIGALPFCINKKIRFNPDYGRIDRPLTFADDYGKIIEIGLMKWYDHSLKSLITGKKEVYFGIAGHNPYLVKDRINSSTIYTFGNFSYSKRRAILQANLDFPLRVLMETRKLRLASLWQTKDAERRIHHFTTEFQIFDPPVTRQTSDRPLLELHTKTDELNSRIELEKPKPEPLPTNIWESI